MYSEQILAGAKLREVIIKQRKKEQNEKRGVSNRQRTKKGASTNELSIAQKKQRRAKSVNETASGDKQQQKKGHARRALNCTQLVLPR